MVSMNRLSTEKRAQIIGSLVEGNSIRATVQPARTLTAKHKQGRAYVKEKIANLPPGEKVVIAWTW